MLVKRIILEQARPWAENMVLLNGPLTDGPHDADTLIKAIRAGIPKRYRAHGIRDWGVDSLGVMWVVLAWRA